MEKARMLETVHTHTQCNLINKKEISMNSALLKIDRKDR